MQILTISWTCKHHIHRRHTLLWSKSPCVVPLQGSHSVNIWYTPETFPFLRTLDLYLHSCDTPMANVCVYSSCAPWISPQLQRSASKASGWLRSRPR